MNVLKTTAALLSAVVLAGCAGEDGMAPLAAGLSYDDFQRQYNVDQATMVAMDANNDGVITENEWQAAGY